MTLGGFIDILCVSVMLGSILAGVIPLAGSTKLGRLQGRGQMKSNKKV